MERQNQEYYEDKKNVEHLNLLSIFYFVFGGLSILGSFILFLYTLIFGFVGSKLQNEIHDAEVVFTAMTTIFGVLGVFVLVVGILQIVCGLRLRKQTNRTFCIVIASASMLSFPLGTTLGVFTVIVLTRDTVKDLYQRRQEEIDIATYGMKR